MADKEKNLDEIEMTEDMVEGHFGPQSAPLASTPVDLARLGLNQVAYIRRSVVDNVSVWTIHSASGVPRPRIWIKPGAR